MFFGVPEINIFGHIISGQEIRPDNKKIEAVVNAPKPNWHQKCGHSLGVQITVPDMYQITVPSYAA